MSKNKKYEPAKIQRYNVLIKKLRTLLSDNNHIDDIKFFGVKKFNTKKHIPNNYKYGILVAGLNTEGLKMFRRFYECDEINFLFEQHNRRRRMEKEINK